MSHKVRPCDVCYRQAPGPQGPVAITTYDCKIMLRRYRGEAIDESKHDCEAKFVCQWPRTSDALNHSRNTWSKENIQSFVLHNSCGYAWFGSVTVGVYTTPAVTRLDVKVISAGLRAAQTAG